MELAVAEAGPDNWGTRRIFTTLKGLPESQQPAPMVFWYRESPRPLQTEQFGGPGMVTLGDPPLRVSGMVSLMLDSAGRLVYLEAVPPQMEDSPPAQKPLDPAPLFTAAGLDLAQFKPAEPHWTPLASVDARAAWTGIFPGRPENPIRVEAAAWRGKPVYFQIIGPWTQPSRMQIRQSSSSQRANQLLWTTVFVIMIIAGSLLAWRNLRLGRGDRHGAFRIAVLAFAVSMGMWIFGGHHVPWPGEVDLFSVAAAVALLQGAQLWIAYIALEPFVRRHWPKTIIAWTRSLSGGLRDPLVGRDIFIGLLVGVAYDLVIAGALALDMRQGDGPGDNVHLPALGSFPGYTSVFLNHVLGALGGGLVFFLILFLLRVLLRREWLAGLAMIVIFAGVRGLNADHPVIDTSMFVVIYGILVVLMLRFGLLAVVVCSFVTDLIIALVFTPDFTAWYGTTSLLTLLSLIALALYAFRIATAGKPLFAGLLDR